MPRSFRHLARFCIAFTACLLTGCALSVEGELPDVEVIEQNIAIPGVVRGGVETFALTVAQKVPRFNLPSSVFAEIRVREVSIAATSGVSDLSFIRALRVTANHSGNPNGNGAT